MISLELALDRLLYKPSYRRAFVEGRLGALDLAPDDLASLMTVDRLELERAAARIERDLLNRQHRGCGALRAQYAKTIDAWRRAHATDEDLRRLTGAFLESDAFEGYREMPSAEASVGLSLEEAFFRFCEAKDIGDAAVREDEFLTAMAKALALSPSPAFHVPEAMRRCAQGYWAVGRRAGRPRLYAAVKGRLVVGAITPFVEELLLSRRDEREVARRHGVSEGALAESVEALRDLGLGREPEIEQRVLRSS